MRKYLIGLIVGLAVAVPATVFATKIVVGLPAANDIYETNCGYRNSSGYENSDGCRNVVSVFDDQDNKCYIAYDYGGGYNSISCVKR